MAAQVIRDGRRVTDRSDIVIPASSALAPMIRRGIQGKCISCGQALTEHFGHRGVWEGCQNALVPDGAVFMLIPIVPSLIMVKDVRIPGMEDKSAGAELVAAMGREEDGASKRFGRTPVLYTAVPVDKTIAEAMPERVWNVYQAIASRREGIERRALLKALKASKAPGGIDSAIRRLKTQFKAIEAQPVMAEAST